MRTGVPVVGKEEKENWADGHVTWVTTTKMPLRDTAGKIIETFGISRDITERKHAELQASEYAEENRRLCDIMASEFQMAAELQKTFFPHTYPTFPDGVSAMQSAVRFCHHCHSSGTVGGDFCSVRKLSESEAAILICDVMGHGVRAALVTALIRAIVEEISIRENDPGRFLEHMNRMLKPIIQSGDLFLFSTACYMILDVSTGTVRYAIAGHPVPIRLNTRNRRAEWLTEDAAHSGPALAVSLDTEYETIEQKLSPNDVIILYTDGLYELKNAEGEEYGQSRLLEATTRYRDMSVRTMFPTLIDEIRLFSPSGRFDDDVSMVGCRFAHPLNA